MPCLVGEHGDRPSRPTSGRLVLEGEPIEVVADLRSQDRQLSANESDAVGVLHGADVVTRLVATD